MTEQKEYLLEVRAMTWEENCAFEDMRAEVVKEIPNNALLLGRKCIEWVINKMYPGVLEKLTPAEATAVFNTTLELSNAVRFDEIKNLKPLLPGSANGADTAKTAEK